MCPFDLYGMLMRTSWGETGNGNLRVGIIDGGGRCEIYIQDDRSGIPGAQDEQAQERVAYLEQEMQRSKN